LLKLKRILSFRKIKISVNIGNPGLLSGIAARPDGFSVKRFHFGSVALILFTLLLNGSCSVFQVYDLREFPEASRTLYLQNFSNETFDPDVNVELNRIMRNTIHLRGNFILTNDREKARYHLHGSLILYRREGRMYDNYRNPTRYMLAAGVLIKLRENITGNEKEEIPVFTQELSSTLDYSVSEGFAETESEARTRLLEQLASSVNRAIEKEFISRMK
jgi:hypothetical protein